LSQPTCSLTRCQSLAPGRPGKTTDAELIALSVAQAVLGIPSDRQFLGMIRRLLPDWFPELPGQSQFNRRLRRLTPQISAVQMMLAELVAEGRVRLVALRLAAGQAGALLFADGGFWGREYLASMESLDIELVTPDKHRLGRRPPAEVAKARIRLVIESVFSTLKRQMRLETHLARTPGGLAQRIAQRLLALTLGIYVNTLIGRPPRALAAYDGR
jgi:hypothetical protein